MMTLISRYLGKEKNKKTSVFGVVFWTSIIFVYILFFAVFYYSYNIYMADSIEYLMQAYNIKAHLSFYCADLTKEINPALYTKRPPMYGLVILFIKTIYNSNYFVLFVQNLLSIANIIGLIKILHDYKFEFDVKKSLYIFIVFFPAQYIYVNMIMSEILLQTFIFWALFNLFYYIKNRTTRNIIYYNIILALAVLTKPVLVYFWIPNLIFMAYLYYKNKKTSTLLSGLIHPVFVLLFSYYGYTTTGNLSYSSQKPVNLLDYYATFLLISVNGEDGGWKRYGEIHSYLDTIKDYSKMSIEAEKIAMEIILDNKIEYAKLHLKGMLNYFFDPGRYDLNYLLSVKEKNHSGLMIAFAKGGYGEVVNFVTKQPYYVIVYLSLMLIINFCFVLSLILFLFNKRVYEEIKFFVLFMAVYMSFLSGMLGTMRYKIHIYFLLLFTIPFAIEYIKSKNLLKRKQPL